MLLGLRSSLILLAAYVAAMGLGRVFTLESTGLALFWPAAGVATVWLVRAASRAELATGVALLFTGTVVFFGALLGFGLAAAVLLGVANVVQALVARGVLGLLRRRAATREGPAAVAGWVALRSLVLAAVCAALVGAPIGAAASWAQTGDLGWSTAVSWLVRNTCGIVVPVAALGALAGTGREHRPRGRRPWLSAESRAGAGVELAVVVSLTVAAGAVVALTPDAASLTYVLLALAVWVGFRFTPGVGGVYTFVFGVVAVMLTLAGLGPFGRIDDVALRANDIQLFVTTTMLLVLVLAYDISQLTWLSVQLGEAELRARSRADLLDAVNGAVVDGLCVSDSWGHVLLANPAAAELGGSDEHGQHVHDASSAQWFHPDGSPIANDDLPHARALRGEVVELRDVVRRDLATGQEKVLAVSAVPLHVGAPASTEVAEARPLAVVMMRDVTWQRAQLRAQENFVAVVAHDLKGPVSGVLSWAEVAQDQVRSELEAERAAASASLARIERTAARMNLLITDLLDYTVAASAPLHVRRIDLDELVDSIVADLERPGGTARITRGPLGAVAADELLVRQLFGNLLANAVKYVAPGVAPRVRIEARPVDDVVELQVSDNGIGIPAADRSRVFDSFYRAGESRAVPGFGLGLPICLRAVERHGGWIAAHEGPGGVGTTFRFTLPAADPRPQAGAPAATQGTDASDAPPGPSTDGPAQDAPDART